MSFIFFAFFFLLVPSFGLNTDGVLLLSFKYSILSDPLSVLHNWNYDDETPCSWNGVTCTQIDTTTTTTPWSPPDMFRVTSLILPNSQLLGSVTKDLGLIQHLRHLDLSNNLFNGSLPLSIFNATELQVLSLSNNVISGELPDLIGQMLSLQLLNLSVNALAGKLPKKLTALKKLTVVSLRSNHFSGSIPGGFSSVEVLDLSSNLLNGSLPLDFGGDNLRYLNLSANKISGSISPEFVKRMPQNVTIDLSFNNLTGVIPEALPLANQRTESFSGNVELCGKPLKNLCSIPSTLSTPPPNVTTTTTSPAIAVIPKSIDSVPVTNSPPTATGTSTGSQNQRAGLKPGTIAAIAVADLAGIGVLGLVILYVYQLKKRKTLNTSNMSKAEKKLPVEAVTVTKTEHATWSCLKIIQGEETSDANTSSDSDQDSKGNNKKYEDHVNGDHQQQEGSSKGGTAAAAGTLVTVDGETELELETLFKASAYILGTSSSSIVYKAVLADGTALAVRRIGETCFQRLKDFESQVRAIAKLKHPNLVKLRGFYWGDEEKLLISDYLSNGCLASFSSRKPGSSSQLHLPVEVRLKIARGVARGLAYIHEKKHVHGNIKPSNILFNSEMEPIITDLGLDRLVSTNNINTNNNTSYKAANSTGRLFGNHHAITTGSSPYAAAGSSGGGGSSMSPYQAPELLRTLKPNPKWDVYSFGIVLLELLTGRVLSERELGSVPEEKIRVLRMVDVAIRGDVESNEDAMLACFKLGFSCASFVPHKRPSMKEAAQILEKIPC